MAQDKLLLKLMGMNDPRSQAGIFLRGKNVYRGTSTAAHFGKDRTGRIGRPRKSAIQRRLKRGMK